ncbi:MAG: sulfite exporter TauE/SafE family protein [Acidobacteria bacterium]|nr:sulfite exporter TauE/SafE family protein [Acidobacteriota bacterium]
MTAGVLGAVLLAVLIGVALGTLGSGGSIITMPVLVYVAGIPAHQAVAMSLVIVGTTAAVGGLIHARHGAVRPRIAGMFAAAGAVGAWGGSHLTRLVSGPALMGLFAALMVTAGVRMLAPGGQPARHGAASLTRCAAVGFVVGILTGFLGVGGGFLIVPALVLFAGLEITEAVPNSLAIIAFNSLGGLLGQLGHARIDWPIMLAMVVAALAGMIAGTRLVRRVSPGTLRRAFAWVIVLLGIAIGSHSALAAAGVI